MKGLELANLGVRDFFALLVPGAVFLLLIPPTKNLIDDSVGGVLVFTIGAYLCGCIASGVGSTLDWIVDPIIRTAVARLKSLKPLNDREALATNLKDRIIQSLISEYASLYPESTKSFWWDHLRLNSMQAIVELDRREAYQKLFRSLAVVFFALAGLSTIITIGLEESFEIATVVLFFSGISAAFVYACGRAIFLQSVYRLGTAFCLKSQ